MDFLERLNLAVVAVGNISLHIDLLDTALDVGCPRLLERVSVLGAVHDFEDSVKVLVRQAIAGLALKATKAEAS